MNIFKASLKYYKTCLWFMLMLYLLFSPGNSFSKVKMFNIPGSDKVIHLGMFAMLAFLLVLESKVESIKYFLTMGAVFLFFGALSEFIQFAFIPGRSGTFADLFADLIGIITGILFYKLMWQKIFHSKTNQVQS